jgi:molecular chaperone GrpE
VSAPYDAGSGAPGPAGPPPEDAPVVDLAVESPPDGPGDGTGADGVADARADLERERDEYLDALRRLQADFENYRKRMERQFEELAARGVTALVARLLPVLDALDLAEDHLLAETPVDAAASAETKALVQARALLFDTLAKEGLERAGAAGEPFDPTVHDAVAHAEGDDGPVVDEVLRGGYRWRGQVLRPAMVKVRG